MHCSISSLQQPAQRVSTTQDGMKMCSTSSGYSCMISTRSSRGLHKLLLYTSIRGITGERESQCTDLWNGNRTVSIWYKLRTARGLTPPPHQIDANNHSSFAPYQSLHFLSFCPHSGLISPKAVKYQLLVFVLFLYKHLQPPPQPLTPSLCGSSASYERY